MRIELAHAPEGVVSLEDVREGGAKRRHAAGFGINGNRHLLPEIEHARIIEAHDVVGVAVGENHGIQAGHALAQSLRAEVGSGINHHRPAVVLQQDGRPGALVVRIGGRADGTLAGEDGHTRGSSGAEKLESHHPLRACRFCNSTNVMRSS